MKEVKEVYLAMQTALTGIAEHYDLWRDQVKDTKEQSFPRPAVLVKFGDIRWKTLNAAQQIGTLPIEIHAVFSNLGDTYAGAPGQDAALAMLDFFAAVDVALNGLSGASFSPLTMPHTTLGGNFGSQEICIFTYETGITKMIQPQSPGLETQPEVDLVVENDD